MKRSKRAGFTLLEVMIVTGISMIITMTGHASDDASDATS